MQRILLWCDVVQFGTIYQRFRRTDSIRSSLVLKMWAECSFETKFRRRMVAVMNTALSSHYSLQCGSVLKITTLKVQSYDTTELHMQAGACKIL